MGHAELNEIYRRRVTNPGIYLPTNDMAEQDLQWGAIGGVKRVGYGLLVFGHFRHASELDCQPWVVSAVDMVDDESISVGKHGLASQELIRKHNSGTSLAFEFDSSKLSRDALRTYVWRRGPREDGAVGMLVTGRFSGARNLASRDAKVAAVARLTEPDEVLNDHRVYMDDVIIANGVHRLRVLSP